MGDSNVDLLRKNMLQYSQEVGDPKFHFSLATLTPLFHDIVLRLLGNTVYVEQVLQAKNGRLHVDTLMSDAHDIFSRECYLLADSVFTKEGDGEEEEKDEDEEEEGPPLCDYKDCEHEVSEEGDVCDDCSADCIHGQPYPDCEYCEPPHLRKGT